jgi:release factor glutamine methyltransferase
LSFTIGVSLRRIAARLEALAFEARGGLDETDHVEHVDGAALFVPRTVLSPRTFKTGVLLARTVATRARPTTRILDMGSGTGIVAVFASRRGAEVVAIDLNPAAVRATCVNAMLSDVSIDAREGDLFAPLRPCERFDLIAFNPPFFGARVTGSLELALSGGRDLEVLDRFLNGARAHLSPDGTGLIAGSTLGALQKMRALYERHGFRWRTVRARERISERLVIDEIR